MILEYNNITVDFFDKFPPDIKKVILYLSGGADSALILYFLSQLNIEIFPLHGYEVSQPELDSISAAQNIIDWVRNKNTNSVIHDLFIYPIEQKDKTKYYYIKPARKYLQQKYDVHYCIFGTSQGMENDERPANHDGTVVGEQLLNLPWDDILVPWAKVNKKFIAAQYEKFNLGELSLLTRSCIESSVEPCRSCWWCKERYWAFGSYDRGLQ